MFRAARMGAAVAALIVAAACGSGSGQNSPTAPTTSAGTTSTTSSMGSAQPAPATATVTGSLSTGTSTGTASPSAASPRLTSAQTVTVVGTSVSSPIDTAGRFALNGVPSGAVQLRFAGPGTDATLSIGSVQSGETITLLVAVSGPLAAIITDSRNPNAAQIPVNGEIDTLTGTADAFQFKIGSRVIRGDTLTAFFGDGDRSDSFATLHEGSRVEVKSLQRDGFLYAFRIHINGATDVPPVPPAPAPAPPDTSASIEGTLTSMGGTAPVLQLVVGGTPVVTNADTVVQRRGDRQTLATLRLGMTLHVVGDRQANGTLIARFIQIKDDEAGGQFEIEGSLGGLKGSCPAISFGVNGYSVVAGTTTTYLTPCANLKNGNKVRVRGTRLANGDVQATEIGLQ